MARIVELTYPGNVILLPGATQNWRDLPEPDGPAGPAGIGGTNAPGGADAPGGPDHPGTATARLDLPADDPERWVDPSTGDIPGPGATAPLLHGLVDRLLAGLPTDRRRVLVVGPHDPRLLARIAAQAELTVVVRAIPDAAAIGAALPGATVLCGNLADARRHAGTYDLVVALDDVTRVHSLEDAPRAWRELADEVVACVAEGGSLALGVENDLGLHRLLAARSEEARDLDANWSPLMTWDASRPRTPRQVAEYAEAVAATLTGPATVRQLFPDWRAPHTAGSQLDRADRPLRDLLAALAGRPVGDRPAAPGLVQRRAVAMADRWPEVCAGWVLLWGPATPVEDGPALLQARGDGRTIRWVAGPDGRVHRTLARTDPAGVDPDLVPVVVPPLGRTLLLDLVEAATASDTPRLRRVLGAWRDALDARTDPDGRLPAAYADARFGNLLAGTDASDERDNDDLGNGCEAGTAPVPLEPGPAGTDLAEARWLALADLLATWRRAGIRTPWPSSMHPHTVFRALASMAGIPAPDDVDRYWPGPVAGAGEEPMTGQEMRAVIARQREQLRGAWSRFHWDERAYLTYRAEDLAGRIVRRLGREAARGARSLTRHRSAE